MSEEVVATAERSRSICLTVFLVPLPEGEVIHLLELKACKSVPRELCKVSLPSGSSFRMPTPPLS